MTLVYAQAWYTLLIRIILEFQSVSFHSERQFASNTIFLIWVINQNNLAVQTMRPNIWSWLVVHEAIRLGNFKSVSAPLHPTDIWEADWMRCCRVLATQAAAPLVYIPVEKLFSKWYVSISYIFLSTFCRVHGDTYWRRVRCAWPVRSIWHRPT